MVVKPARLVLQIFLAPVGGEGLGLIFPFWGFCHGSGLSLSYNNHRCSVSGPLAVTAPWKPHSALCSCTRLALINYLAIYPLDQSVRCTALWGANCIHSPPSLLTIVAHEVPAQCTSVPLL